MTSIQVGYKIPDCSINAVTGRVKNYVVRIEYAFRVKVQVTYVVNTNFKKE